MAECTTIGKRLYLGLLAIALFRCSVIPVFGLSNSVPVMELFLSLLAFWFPSPAPGVLSGLTSSRMATAFSPRLSLR